MPARRSIALAAALVAGCGAGSSQQPSPPPCSPATALAVTMIRLADYNFEPACFTVSAGTDVTFFNDDPDNIHEVATQDGQVESFDSGILAFGATFRHTFATPGTIGLYCRIFAGMTATAIVTPP